MPNHLIFEKSPYLLQHANNPVDWRPWGKDALDQAALENKPIFLSIGYSTCHWCHVMAHESFEDTEVASILNEHFIPVKVDREERPDLDAVYMNACQIMTGSGGWPLNLFLTPEQEPFFAGTYFPKHNRYGSIGLIELMTEITRQWNTNRQKLMDAGKGIREAINRQAAQIGDETAIQTLLQRGVEAFQINYDSKWGGFGTAPKFPAPHNLMFLTADWVARKEKSSFTMVEHTLDQMYRGGIFDHIGGGFSRYSTDDRWLVPHFEKMLYDNALLADLYLSVYQLTGKKLYRRIVQKIFHYALRELRDPQGGFYCGQDADSEGVEGKFYVFTQDEIQKVLGEEDARLFCRWFGVTKEGNFEGKNVLNLIQNPDYEKENNKIEELCQKIYAYRAERTDLHKDDKVLTSWNGLMMAALANAGRILGDSCYLQAGLKVRNFIAENMKDGSGRLFLRWRDGESAGMGQLDDYAFYSYGLLALYQAAFEISYLEEAIRTAEKMVELFFDFEQGGFYLYASDAEQLISRPKEVYDGAIPSGNSIAAWVLHHLAELTGETKWSELAGRQLSFLSRAISHYPAGSAFALLAMREGTSQAWHLVCASNDSNAVERIHLLTNQQKEKRFSILLKTSENAERLAKAAPFTADYTVPESGDRYYLCQDKTCYPPMSWNEIEEFFRRD